MIKFEMVMNARELRIGNYVDYGLGREPQRITGNDLYMGVEGRPFRPIPLTEEWLLNFGFKFDPNKGFEYISEATGEKQRIEDRPHYFILLEDRRRFIISIAEDGYTYMVTTKIQYVHQLQNLYFVLFGKELSVKESPLPEQPENK